MVRSLERVVVAVDDLEEAMRDYGRLLGRSPSGEDRFVLRNTTVQLVDRASSEIADRSPDPGVAALVFEEDERGEGEWLEGDATRGIPIGLVGDSADRDEANEAGLSPETVKPAETVSALDHVVISTGDLDAARALYGGRLGLRLALDRVFEKRGIQILFYRVGGTTVEVVGALPDARRSEGGPGAFAPDVDRFGGLAWEVEDVRAIHARLAREDFDVSDVRVGHKPGTLVCTVRGPSHGVPTLLKGPDRG